MPDRRRLYRQGFEAIQACEYKTSCDTFPRSVFGCCACSVLKGWPFVLEKCANESGMGCGCRNGTRPFLCGLFVLMGLLICLAVASTNSKTIGFLPMSYVMMASHKKPMFFNINLVFFLPPQKKKVKDSLGIYMITTKNSGIIVLYGQFSFRPGPSPAL